MTDAEKLLRYRYKMYQKFLRYNSPNNLLVGQKLLIASAFGAVQKEKQIKCDKYKGPDLPDIND